MEDLATDMVEDLDWPQPLRIPGVRIDVVELLGSLATDDLASTILQVCRPRPEVRQKLLLAWKDGMAFNGPEAAGGAVKQLLEPAARPHPQPVSEEAAKRDQELWRAVCRDDAGEVARLLKEGATQAFRGPDGCGVAAIAVARGHSPDVLRLLLEGQADLLQRNCTDLSMVHLWSVQVLLSKQDQEEAREKLLHLTAASADLNARVRLSGDTPLHLVARDFERHRRSAAKPEAGLFHHRSLLAAKLKFRLLLSAGADLGRWNCDSKTPLQLVSDSFRKELQKEFREPPPKS